MLKIKLKRKGRKKLPYYRIVVTPSTTPRGGKPVDELGVFDPHSNYFELDKMKFSFWINNGASPTSVIRNLVYNNILS